MMSPHPSAAKHWSRVLAGQCFNVFFSDSIPQHNYAVHNSGGGKTVFLRSKASCSYKQQLPLPTNPFFRSENGVLSCWRNLSLTGACSGSAAIALSPAAPPTSHSQRTQCTPLCTIALCLEIYSELRHILRSCVAFCNPVICILQTTLSKSDFKSWRESSNLFLLKNVCTSTLQKQISPNSMSKQAMLVHPVPLHSVLQTDWYELIEWNSM